MPLVTLVSLVLLVPLEIAVQEEVVRILEKFYSAGSGAGLSQATVPILPCVTTRATRLALTSNLSSLARLEVRFYPCAEHYLLEGTPSKEK